MICIGRVLDDVWTTVARNRSEQSPALEVKQRVRAVRSALSFTDGRARQTAVKQGRYTGRRDLEAGFGVLKGRTFSAQSSASARVASCWSSGATQVQNCPPRFLACMRSNPSSVRPLHHRSYALFHRNTNMNPTGSPRTPCINGDRGIMLFPKRIFAIAARHAAAQERNVACTGPCSRFKTH